MLNIHEYQSKQLMDKYGVRTQKWRLAENSQQAADAAKALSTVERSWVIVAETEGAKELVIKAQIHAGGRGKGHFKETGFKGGVQFPKT